MKLITLLCLVGLLAVAGWAKPQKKDNASTDKPAVSMTQARETALQKEPGKIKSGELEKEKGKLIYSFDIRTKNGIHEVNVDAMTGEVVEDSIESPAAERKELQKDSKPH